MLKRMFALLLFASLVTAQAGSARQYPIDVNHSNVGFSVPILSGLSHVKGKFTDFTVTLNNNEKDITKSSVNVVIKAASISTGIPARDNHLRTADFFDAEKYPEITFQSTRIEKQGKQLIAVGNFTMHGVTKEIALPFTVNGTNKNATATKMNVGYSARITLNRQDFGIAWRNKADPNFVGDNVDIEIDLITRPLDVVK